MMGYFKNLVVDCRECGEEVSPARARLGYGICLLCGEEAARQERTSWCIVQEYTKGNYVLVTAESAPKTLKQTNPKDPRV